MDHFNIINKKIETKKKETPVECNIVNKLLFNILQRGKIIKTQDTLQKCDKRH